MGTAPTRVQTWYIILLLYSGEGMGLVRTTTIYLHGGGEKYVCLKTMQPFDEDYESVCRIETGRRNGEPWSWADLCLGNRDVLSQAEYVCWV